MRNRKIQLNIRLTQSEYDKVIRNSQKANLTVSGYVRMLISGYVPKETPPVEYHEIMCRLTELANKNYGDNDDLCKVILQLQEAVTQPERIKCAD